MALKATYNVRCGCGARFEATVFEYVFAEHDPELKDAILSGEFNRIPCPSCRQAVHAETRFLYRDEAAKVWVWVCRRDEEARRDELTEELIERKAAIEGHFLDHQEAYRKFLVFGREALIELLLREDRALKRTERKPLRDNAAVHWILGHDEDPGYLFLRGNKIRIAMPLRLSLAGKTDAEARTKWLRSYAQGLNIHNPYSSFLDARLQRTWNQIRETERFPGSQDEFDGFARSWARYKTDGRAFGARYPKTRAFFHALKNTKITRPLRPLRAKKPAGLKKKGLQEPIL